MKKQLKSLIIMMSVVVVAAIAVTVLVLTDNKEPTEPTTPSANKYEALYEMKKEQIEKIDISLSDQSFTITQTATGGFTIDLLKDSPENQSAVELSANYMAAPKVKTGFALENVSDLAQYGLDKPVCSFTVEFNDKTTKSFALGSSTVANDGYYMLDTQTNNVYIAATVLYNYVTMTPLDYISTALVPTLDNDSINTFNYMIFSGSKRAEELKIISLGNDSSNDNQTYVETFKMVKPLEYSVDDYKVQTLFSQLSGLIATNAVEYTADKELLKKYGLDNPLYTFEIDFPSKNYKLYFGNKDDNGNYYVMAEGKNAIYTVSAKSVEFAFLSEYDYARRTDIIPKIDDLSAITITAKDKSYTFTLKGTGDNLIVGQKGSSIDTDLFRSFYINLISMGMDGGMKRPENLRESDIYFSVTYEYKDSSKENDVIEYYNTDGRKFFRLTNGEGFFYSVKDTLDNVINDLDKLLSGKPITER